MAWLLLAACSSPPAGHLGAPDQPSTYRFVGDVLLGDEAAARMAQEGIDAPLRALPVGPPTIANLEGPLTERTRARERGDPRWTYASPPAAAPALARHGVVAAGLSNNHTWDRGPGGLQDSLRALREAGIVPFGAGDDEAQATAPLLLQGQAGLVAVVALSERWDGTPQAGWRKPGLAGLDQAEEAVRRARAAGAQRVVAFVHWGENYQPITMVQRRAARRLVDLGVDLVVGHHPHVPQAVELLDGVPVIYSLGNYVFGTAGRFDEAFPGFGLTVDATFDPEGLAELAFRCLRTDNVVVHYQPRPCTPEEAATVWPVLGLPLDQARTPGAAIWSPR